MSKAKKLDSELLEELIDSEEMILVTISPKMAAKILNKNISNRPLSNNVVSEYSAEMKAGNWRLTAQPIQFSKSGRFLDGQHRLWAVVESEVEITAWAKFGEPEDNFAFIDTGKPRNASDIFAIHGVPHYTLAAAAARWVYAIEKGKSAHTTHVTPHELYEYFDNRRGIEESINFIGWKSKKDGQVCAASFAVAMHYLFSRRDKELADAFMVQLVSGEGSNPTVNRLRNVFIAAMSNPHKRLSRNAMAVMVIKVWNTVRKGKELKQIKLTESETIQKIR